MLHCNRGQTDFQCWMVRYEIASRSSGRHCILGGDKECADDVPELEVKGTPNGESKPARQEGIKALKKLFEAFEAQLKWQEEVDQEEESLSDSQEEAPVEHLGQPTGPLIGFSSTLSPQEYEDAVDPKREPQLYLCDDWIRHVEVMQKLGELNPQDKAKARVAKNFVLVTLMSLKGLDHSFEDCQREGDTYAEFCYSHEKGGASP